MDNDQKLKELLDFAEVDNLDNGNFDLKLALPAKMIEAHLQKCIDTHEPETEESDEPADELSD